MSMKKARKYIPVKKYIEYLRSPKWRAKRWAIGYARNFTCEICHKYCRDNFEIHHKTYRNICNEPDCDLLLLCSDCHKKVEIKKRLERREKY